MPDIDLDRLVSSLDAALDQLLTCRITVGGMPGPLPAHALEAALGAHDGVILARADASAALRRLLGQVGEEHQDAVLEVEAAVRLLIGRAAEASWAMAMLWATSGKTKDKEWAK